MMKLYKKLHKAAGLLEYFSVRQWSWSSKNLDMLKGQLSAEDQQVRNVPLIIAFNS